MLHKIIRDDIKAHPNKDDEWQYKVQLWVGFLYSLQAALKSQNLYLAVELSSHLS